MAFQISKAKRIIRETLQELVGVGNGGQIDFDAIFDDEHSRYQVIAIGWEGFKQLLHTTAYVEIKDDLIWLHADNTDYGIAEEFVRQGIPKNRIVLGFQPPTMRQYTDYATGEKKSLETAAD
jgi:XisI protein